MAQGFATSKSITRVRIAWEQFHRKSLFLTGRKLFSPHHFCFSLPFRSWFCSFCVLGQPVVSDSLRPHGLSLTKLLCPWNSCPGKNAEVGSHSLLQGIFVTQGLNPGPPPRRRILYRLSHQSSPDVAARYWECEVQPAEGALSGCACFWAVSGPRTGWESRTNWWAQTSRTVLPQQHPSLDAPPRSAEDCWASANEDTHPPFWCGRLPREHAIAHIDCIFSVFSIWA